LTYRNAGSGFRARMNRIAEEIMAASVQCLVLYLSIPVGLAALAVGRSSPIERRASASVKTQIHKARRR
jgi:hypothetical protein